MITLVHLMRCLTGCLYARRLRGVGLALLLALLLSDAAHATHFTHGYLIWYPRLDISATTVEFKLVITWRRDGFSGTGLDRRPVVGDIITDFSSNLNRTSLVFGDGRETRRLNFIVTAFNAEENWFTAQAIDPLTGRSLIVHTYPSPDNNGAPWRAVSVGEERISNTENAPDEVFRLITLVETRSGNSSPVVGDMPPVITVPENTGLTLTIPVTDPDANSRLRYRLATFDESGITNQPGPPSAPEALTVDETTGEVAWNTAGAAPGTKIRAWSTQIIIEDRSASTGALLTQIALDFVIRVLPVNDPPVLAPVPDTTITVNQLLEFTLSAADPDGDRLSFSMENEPVGATLRRTSDNTARFSWQTGPEDGDRSYRVTFIVTEMRADPLSDQQESRITVGHPQVLARPNPFTPNADGFNDRVVFNFETLGYPTLTLTILDFEGRVVQAVTEPEGFTLTWDGLGENGEEQRPGIYLYLIENGAEVVASGSVVLAR